MWLKGCQLFDSDILILSQWLMLQGGARRRGAIHSQWAIGTGLLERLAAKGKKMVSKKKNRRHNDKNEGEVEIRRKYLCRGKIEILRDGQSGVKT